MPSDPIRGLLKLAIIPLAVVGIVWAIQSSQSFEGCVSHTKHHSPYNDAFPAFSRFGLGHSFVRDRLVAACSARFIDIHNGVITALATGIVAWFTFGLFNATRALWKAGENQRLLAESTARHQLRAYITLDTFKINDVCNGPTVVAKDFNVILRNTGSTPTVDLLCHASVWFEKGDLPSDFRFPDTFVKGRANVIPPTFLAPGDKITILNFQFSTFQMAQVARREMLFYIYGWADYSDVFGATPRHRTEFCTRVLCEGDPASRADGAGIVTDIYWKHNGMDAECMRAPTSKVVRAQITPAATPKQKNS